MQGRSRDRFERVLVAVEELLQTANVEDISLYDIASHARLSAPSIHYLFPTTTALRIELLRRYNQRNLGLIEEAQATLIRLRNPRWQDWVQITNRAVRDDFNSNRHVSEVLMGPNLNRESRRENIRSNEEIGRGSLENFKRIFLVPEIPRLAETFTVGLEATDALWSRSYILRGRISDKALEEGINMQIAYLRTVLPEVLPLSPAYLEK